MGAWATGTFDNDTAADWGGEVASSGSVDQVIDTLHNVAESDAGSVDSHDACEALAAAELVATAAGNPPEKSSYNAKALAWATGQKELNAPEVKTLALKAIDVAMDEGSELRDLWSENPTSLKEFLAIAEDLRARLR